MSKFNIKKGQKTNIGIFIFIFALIGFIVATFYDLQAAEWLGKGMQYQPIKFVTIFFNYLGLTAIILPFLIGICVWVETFFAYKKSKMTVKIRHKILLWSYYVLCSITWFVFNIVLLMEARFIDEGWGIGINVTYVTTWVYGFIAQSILTFLSTLILIWVIYNLRVKFSHGEVLIKKEYWIKSTQSIIFIIITYLILIFIKQSFGRPYYMNLKNVYETTIWNEAVNEGIFDPNNPQDVEIFKNSQVLNMWGSAETYLPWYKINGNWFSNLKFWYPGFSNIQNSPGGWRDNDFPSGHTLSMFCLFTLSFYFEEDQKSKYNVFLKILGWLWLVSLIIMMTTLCIARSHWLTDVFFTCLFTLPIMFFLPKKVEKVCKNFKKN